MSFSKQIASRLLTLVFPAISMVIVSGGSAGGLQISFPATMEDGEVRQQEVVLRRRSLRERFDRFDLVYSGDFYRFGTYGDRSRAFRPDHFYNVNNLSLFGQVKLQNGLDYELQLTNRYATDPAVTFRDDVHVTSFYSSLGRKDVWLTRVGDLYPNLSRYTLNRFAKGGQAWFNRPVGDDLVVRLTGVLGRVERSREMTSLRRVAIGSAATIESARQVRYRPAWTVGYRYAGASDQLGSVDNALNLADLQIDGHSVVYSAQLPWGLGFQGENAWSQGTTDRRVNRSRDGYAWSADLSWLKQSRDPYSGLARLAPFAAQAFWELTDPYFQAPLGIASADQRRWGGRTAHRFNPNVDWTLSFLRLEDNVRDQGLNTNITRTSNAVVNFRPFLLFGEEKNWTHLLPESVRAVRMKMDFRFNDRDASNGLTNQKIEDYIYQVLYANWGWNFTGDYQFQITDDDAVPVSDRRLQAYGVRMTRPFHWREWNMRFFPLLAYRVSRDRFRLTGSATRLQTTTAGVSVNWEELSGMLNYTYADADRTPAGNDYRQQRIASSVTYKPYLYPNFSSTLTYGYGDVDDEQPRRSYRQTETRLIVGYTF